MTEREIEALIEALRKPLSNYVERRADEIADRIAAIELRLVSMPLSAGSSDEAPDEE